MAAIFFLLVVDFPSTIKLGANSVAAVITIALTFMLTILLILNLLVIRGHVSERCRLAFWAGLDSVPVILITFALYAVVRLAVDVNAEGIQNVLCYLMFVLSALVTASSVQFDYQSTLRWMAISAGLCSFIFLLQSALYGSSGSFPFIGDRSYAMSALIGLAVLIPAKSREIDRHSPPRSPILPLLIIAALILSLSRTAIAVALILVLFFAVRVRKSLRIPTVAITVVSSVGLLLAVVSIYPPILERFTEGDNAQIGGVAMNTSGRTELWQVTYSSAMRSPIWGNGPGDSSELLHRMISGSGIGHPHSDYLRILNDLGFVGSALLWGGLLILLVRCWRSALRTDEARHWTAVMAILSVLLVSITDNVIVYQFIMIPVGVIIGMSLRATPSAIPAFEWEWSPETPARVRRSMPA